MEYSINVTSGDSNALIIDEFYDFFDEIASATSKADSKIAPFSSFGTSYKHEMSANDAITEGVGESVYIWEYELLFENTSASDINLSIDFSYQLNAGTSGQDAYSEVALDILDDLFLENYVFADTGTDGVFHEPSVNGSETVDITLETGEFYSLYLDTYIVGYLETSPVPVPPAFWLMSSALLGLLGLKKRNA